MDRRNQKEYRNERRKLGKKCKKTESGKLETVRDSFVIVDPYPWKQLKNDDDDYDDNDET